MKREGGYTLVEIGLVMAVSAGLLLIAGSLYVMSGNQRFTDSLQTIRTFIEQQYNDVRSNISQRVGGDESLSSLCPVDSRDSAKDKSAGNSKNCLLMGKIIQFKNDRMKSSYVIGVQPTNDWPDTNKTAVQNIQSMRLYAVTSSSAGRGIRPTEKLYSNGNEAIATLVCDGKECDDSRSQAPGDDASVLILHSPLDNSILTFSYTKLDGESSEYGGLSKVINIGDNSYTGLVLAMQSGSSGVRTGALCVPVSSTSSGIQTASPADGLSGSSISDRKALFNVCSEEID